MGLEQWQENWITKKLKNDEAGVSGKLIKQAVHVGAHDFLVDSSVYNRACVMSTNLVP